MALPSHFARRIAGLVQSDIRRMSRRCAEVDGINLGQGICDQPVEDLIKGATVEAIHADHSTYSPFEGIAGLRQCIADKMLSYNGIRCDPETEVLVTAGSTGAFVIAALSLLDPGDEVIVFTPFYGYHINLLNLCETRIRFVETRAPDWNFDEAELAAAFSERTRAIVVNTPNNPSGKVFRRSEMETIADLCQRHDALAITDEIYEYILYDDREHVSLGSLPGMADRTITISGFSKTYSMTGWRLGYAVCSAPIAERLGVINDLLYICAPTPLQHGVTKAFDLPQEYYDGLRRDYTAKRERMATACRDAGMRPWIPEGAYYMLADLGDFPASDDREAAELLLARAGVAVVPGSSFFPEGDAGRRVLRFCFAKTDDALEQACGQMRQAFA